jgi:histidine triad (HIT) family protein
MSLFVIVVPVKQSVFSKFISRELHCSIVYEDDSTFAFLDQRPVTKGHTLVVTKEQIDHLDDCPDKLYNAVFKTVHKISKQLKKQLKPMRIAIVVHGLEIPHTHVHVVPLYTGKELHLASRKGGKKTSNEILDAQAQELFFK